MDALGVVANVIAVVNLSAKVATLCVQYSKEVASARADIQRLQSQVEHLGNALRATQAQVERSKTESFLKSQKLVGLFRNCIGDLEQLDQKLRPAARRRMHRFGFRALKWPFSSKEVDQLLSSLERHEKTILLGLQIDQTSLLTDIHEGVTDIQQGVKQLKLQSTEDASTSRKPHRMVPFPPEHDFVHRPTIENWMQDQYGQPGRRMALVGLGGFGKSQLAIQFAHQVDANEPGTSVYWVHGHNRETFEESFLALADVLALPRRHEPDADVLALVRDWLQRDDVSPWLMVVDNADDIGVFYDNQRRPLASYIPKSTRGKVLVTSRSLEVAEKLVGSSRAILQIPVMGEEQALELLLKRLEGEADESAARNLVHALDCIPLAVNQAAAYINRRSPRVSVGSYLNEFRTSEKRKDSLLRSDKGDLGRIDGVSNSVVVTWQVTFEQIRREQPRAVNLLSLMSQFQAQNIPESMLYRYNDAVMSDSDSDKRLMGIENASDSDITRGDFEDDLDVLRGYSLVALGAKGFCEMHSLVQFCTRSWISEFGDPVQWSQLFLKLAADHFPSGNFETWELCQRLLPHVEPVLGEKPRRRYDLLNWAKVLNNLSRYLRLRGEYSRAEALAEQAAQTRTEILGPGDPDTLTSRAGIASTYKKQGRLVEAEKLQAEVMETCKAKLGADHPYTIASIANLALTYRDQGRWEEAEELEVEVMETSKAKLGADHPDTLTSMNNLALTYKDQGRWEEAEELEVEAMETSKAKLGADHPSTLTSINNLASTYWQQGRWEEAERLFFEVMETRKTRLGADHHSTLISMNNLAITWYDQGRQEDALILLKDCVQALQKKLGHTHPDTRSSVLMLESWQASRPAKDD